MVNDTVIGKLTNSFCIPIVPFPDGNGRTGRALLTKELLREGYAPVVVSIDDKAKYVDLLAKQDISSLALFIRKLSEYEENRMNQFGIKLETDTKPISDRRKKR